MPSPDATATPRIRIRVLGPMSVEVDGTEVALPRSKKTRALLAYLAVTGRAHRRDRLCGLLWDVTDDPRGALRWSLSRARRIFGDHPDLGACIDADRDEVRFRTEGVQIDARQLGAALSAGLDARSTDELRELAALTRGEFLQGLELADFLDYHAWCIAQREQLREQHCAVLAALVQRLADQPAQALPYARARAQADAFDPTTYVDLLRLLVAAGKHAEAKQRHEAARRLYREVGAPGLPQIEQAWRQLRTTTVPTPAAAPVAPPTPAPSREADRPTSLWPFVGRSEELERLQGLLRETAGGTGPKIALVEGEPGAGKSRLAERLASRAASAGFEVLTGRAFEAESSRPYGPWADALGLPVQSWIEGEETGPASREALFAAAAQRLAERATGRAGLLLVLDDLQWLDRDSAELLHFVARTYQRGPLCILLSARRGELGDNAAVRPVLRGLRREHAMTEIQLGPLAAEDIRQLVGRVADGDATRICEAAAGNPLYAIELARAGAGEGPPAPLVQLVRERVERLPDHAADVLRWGAVLGHAIDVERLEALSSLPLDELVDALERLEHHALLRIDATRSKQRYVFGHDIVREAVYGELSHPRRRLMHRKVARLLQPQTSDAAVATEVAHHAGLAGEAMAGVRACIVAGQQSLRVFANSDAEALARRGLRLAEELDEADRIGPSLELLAIQFAARTPDRERAAAAVRPLAERALDLGLTHEARLGFQMLSYLRWESASMAAAHDNIMQAERVSRSGDPAERTVALAQAAKCLVLLERNLGQAEAFAMEASALASRGGHSSSAVSFANGMIAAHRGELEAAVESFAEARRLAREHGERLAEFGAVEHWVMLELDRDRPEAAAALADELAELGGRVRPGAEAPTGRALQALARLRGGDEAAAAALAEAIEQIRHADAKYELSYLLTRWAGFELAAGRHDAARTHAADARDVAVAVGRASETALALATLAECAAAASDDDARAAALAELDRLAGRAGGDLSSVARARLAAMR